MVDKNTEALREARELIDKYEEYVENIKAAPQVVGSVVKSDDSKQWVLVATSNGLTRVKYPTDFSVKCGVSVNLVPQTGAILSQTETEVPGPVAVVRDATLGSGHVEVSLESGQKTVFSNPDVPVEVGDRVMLDSTSNVIVKKIETPSTYVTPSAGVKWSDIAGLEDVKAAVYDMIELPLKHPEILKAYGQSSPKGLLLSGPPGCGKTMVGKAISTSLDELFGSKAGSFIYVKGPEVLNKFVGEAERTIRDIFKRASEHKKKHGSPAVVFIDEADSLLSKRGTGVSSDVEKTIVPAFLAEMDGVTESSAIVVLATNRPDRLDPAVVRDGRVDFKIVVPRPSRSVVENIVEISSKRVPMCGEAPSVVSTALFDSRRVVYKVRTKCDRTLDVFLSDMISGASVTNVVKKATNTAMKRDLAAGVKTPSGVSKIDLLGAVDDLQAQLKNVDHTYELSDFSEKHGISIREVHLV